MEKDLKTKKEKDISTTIELVWESKQDLVDLSNQNIFTNFILNSSYETIKKAITQNLPKVELFNIFNLSVIVEVKKTHYSSILEKVMVLFLEEENYEECSKIKKLIKKIDENV
jgi:hypothetical protein|tara:strand:+ start:59 stop:397 length:339 start_codon:yes stop_codon:yes gene_type:complete